MATSDRSTKQPGRAAAGYEVRLSDTAAAAYIRFVEKARDASGTDNLRQIHEILAEINKDPFDKRNSLVGNLQPIFRIHRNKISVTWIGPNEGRVNILSIVETVKKGSEDRDSIARLISTGGYDRLLGSAGVNTFPAIMQPSKVIN